MIFTRSDKPAVTSSIPQRNLQCRLRLAMICLAWWFAALPALAVAGGNPVQQDLDELAARTLADPASGLHSLVLQLDSPAHDFHYSAALGRLKAGSDDAIAINDRFYIASISKTMTAVRMLQLMEERGLPPDSTLASLDLLDAEVIAALHRMDGKSYGAELTLRQLLSHRSGMKDYLLDDRNGISSEFEGGLAPGSMAAIWMSQWPQYLQCKQSAEGCGTPASAALYPARSWLPWDPAAFAANPHDRDAGLLNFYLSEMADTALFVPGSASHYSDTNFMLLGIIIEKLTGSSLSEQLSLGIFQPLGMAHSYLGPNATPASEHNSRLSDFWIGDTAFPSSGIDTSWDWGGGGVISTAQDLSTFLQALVNGKLFRKAETLQQMLEFVPVRSDEQGMQAGYGLGIRYARTEFGPKWGHSGAWGAKMEYFPELQLFVTGTVNAYGTGAEETLLNESVRLFAKHFSSEGN